MGKMSYIYSFNSRVLPTVVNKSMIYFIFSVNVSIDIKYYNFLYIHIFIIYNQKKI